MTNLFWILWMGEFIGTGWWLQSEMKLTHIKANPYVFLSFLYLMIVLGVRFSLALTKISFAMVLVPAIPVVFMLLIIIISVLTRARWN
jgi:hypothetical protein